MSRLGHPPSVQIALVLAAVTVGTLSTAFALGREEVAPVRVPVAASSVSTACEPACSSHVIAAPLPGEAAIVVNGASAFGMALDGGAAVSDGRRDRVMPQLPGVQAHVEGAVSVGPEGAFRGNAPVQPARVNGGYALASL